MATYSHVLYLIYSIKFEEFNIQAANTTKNVKVLQGTSSISDGQGQ